MIYKHYFVNTRVGSDALPSLLDSTDTLLRPCITLLNLLICISLTPSALIFSSFKSECIKKGLDTSSIDHIFDKLTQECFAVNVLQHISIQATSYNLLRGICTQLRKREYYLKSTLLNCTLTFNCFEVAINSCTSRGVHSFTFIKSSLLKGSLLASVTRRSLSYLSLDLDRRLVYYIFHASLPRLLPLFIGESKEEIILFCNLFSH